ncbi:MAG: OmpA family protein [Deltaproteobacteria bacterium]|nr:OmpA family protein [Deltaproteobacteria bacterium]
MTKRGRLAGIVCAVLGAWFLLAGVGRAAAPDPTHRIEVGPFVGGFVFDEDLGMKNNVVFGGRLGYWLNKTWEPELSFDYVPTASYQRNDDWKDDANLMQLHLDGLYHFPSIGNWMPYLAAGVGMTRYDKEAWNPGADYRAMVNYGAGVKYWFTDNLAARLDLRQPITFENSIRDTRFNFMYTLGVSWLFSAPEAGPAPAAPTATLSASPASVQRGNSSTLTWSTENAKDVTIEGLGAVPSSGSRAVTPTDSTTYRLLAKGPGGTANAQASVGVTAPPVVPVPAPVVVQVPAPVAAAPTASLTANPSSIQKGACSALNWSTQNATDVTIEGLGPVGATGTRNVCPTEDTTYRLVAKGPGGGAQAATTVVIAPPTPPTPPAPAPLAPIALLSANPTMITKGETSKLTWSTQNATDVSIEGIGPVDPNGSRNVTPAQDTTYRLMAKGPGGTAQADASVGVKAPPPPPPPPERKVIEMMILFDFDKDVVKPQYYDQIQKVADFMKAYPKVNLVMEGHTDNVGTEEYNLKLSARRANAVAKVLTEKFGIDMNRITAQSLGETKPIAPNTTKEGRAKNRRVYAILESE